jgi:DNA-binding MurR/RpiR family transcriptional regulator
MAKGITKRPKSLEARIRKFYDFLPESERRIADFILDFPGEIAAYSATELSQFSGGSKAAMTRLVHRLGFENFEEARRTARDARVWGSPMYLMTKDPQPDSFRERLKSHLEQDVTALHRIFDALNEDQFTAIVERICAVKRVWLLGYRNSHYLAGYFRWQLIQVRGDVHVLPGGGETLAEHLSDITPDDLLIVVGFRRRTFEVRQVLGWAGRKKVPSLLIADPTMSGDTEATWTIRCETRGADIFDRYAGVMSLFHFLSMGVVAKAGGRGRKRLAKIEELHEDLIQFG